MSVPGSAESREAGVDMIPCEEALERVYDFLDGELCADWTERVRVHIEMCKKCYPYFDFERVFLDHIRGLRLQSRATEQLEARIRKALIEA